MKNKKSNNMLKPSVAMIESNYWDLPLGKGIDAEIIRCGYCNHNWIFADEHENKMSLKFLRDDGWIHTKKFGWVCPDCNPTMQNPDLVDDGFGISK